MESASRAEFKAALVSLITLGVALVVVWLVHTKLGIKESDVVRFTDLVEKITTKLQAACAVSVESERNNDQGG